jgi:hypothetical protein
MCLEWRKHELANTFAYSFVSIRLLSTKFPRNYNTMSMTNAANVSRVPVPWMLFSFRHLMRSEFVLQVSAFQSETWYSTPVYFWSFIAVGAAVSKYSLNGHKKVHCISVGCYVSTGRLRLHRTDIACSSVGCYVSTGCLRLHRTDIACSSDYPHHRIIVSRIISIESKALYLYRMLLQLLLMCPNLFSDGTSP